MYGRGCTLVGGNPALSLPLHNVCGRGCMLEGGGGGGGGVVSVE